MASWAYAHYCRQYGRLPLAQHRAVLYLERHGQRFGVEFGYLNACERARQHRQGWRIVKPKRKR